MTIPRSLEDGLRDGRVIPFVGAGYLQAAQKLRDKLDSQWGGAASVL